MWARILEGIVWLLRLIGMGGKGHRVTVEIRPEAAIEAERTRQQKQQDSLREKEDDLTDFTIEEAEARVAGDVKRADELLIKLRQRTRELRDAQQRSQAGRPH